MRGVLPENSVGILLRSDLCIPYYMYAYSLTSLGVPTVRKVIVREVA